MKSKKIASIAMVIGGLILLANYSLKPFTEKTFTSRSLITGCAIIFIFLGIFSFKRASKKD